MTNEPTFATIGDETGNIEVRLSYRIVELFSEGLKVTGSLASATNVGFQHSREADSKLGNSGSGSWLPMC